MIYTTKSGVLYKKINLSNCKADTKNKRYHETLFFDWKIKLEKVQLTRDLKDATILYQRVRVQHFKLQKLRQEP